MSKCHVNSPYIFIRKIFKLSKTHYAGFKKKCMTCKVPPPFFSEFLGASKIGALTPPTVFLTKQCVPGEGGT